MKSSQDELIRYIETTVLDQKYKQLPFFYRSGDQTIPFLLKILGSVYRGIDATEHGENLLMKRTIFQTLIRALSHSFRWICAESGRNIFLPSYTQQQIDQEAKEALGWAMNYGKLGQDHVLWSRGIVTSNLDETIKTISFEYAQNFDPFFFLTQATSEEILAKSIFDQLPVAALKKEFPAWVQRFVSQLTVNPSWQMTCFEAPFQNVLSWMNSTIWPELAPETNLGGYTLGDYRHLQASLFLHGWYFSWLEDYLDYQYNFEGEFDSVVLSDTEDKVIRKLSEISGVQSSSVRSILNDLTFDTTSFHSSLSLQPFVKSKSGKMYILARLIPILDLSRMLAGAINKGKKKRIYETLVQKLEQASLDKIEEVFRQLGFVVFREKRLFDSNGTSIIPDFLIFDNDLKILLVIEYKHALAPMGVAEAVSKIRNFEVGKEGVHQLEKYLDFLKNNNSSLRSLGIDIDSLGKISGLLLFRWPMALPISRTPDIQLADWVSLSKVLSNKKISLSSLLDWIKDRPDLSLDLNNWKPSHERINVDDWTYNHLMIMQELEILDEAEDLGIL